MKKLIVICIVIVIVIFNCDGAKKEGTKANEPIDTNSKTKIESDNNKDIEAIDPSNINLEELVNRLQKKYDTYTFIRYYNSENLMDIIDGEAIAYTSFDFKRLCLINYNLGDSYIVIFLFDMGNFVSAYGILSQENTFENIKNKYGFTSAYTQNTLTFCDNKFYIKIQSIEDTKYVNEFVSQVANYIDELIVTDKKNNPISKIEKLFPTNNAINNSLAYNKKDFLGTDFLEYSFSKKYNMKAAKTDKGNEGQEEGLIFISIFKDDTEARASLIKYRQYFEEDLDGDVKKPLNLALPGFFGKASDEWGIHYYFIYKNYAIGVLGFLDEKYSEEYANQMINKLKDIDLLKLIY